MISLWSNSKTSSEDRILSVGKTFLHDVNVKLMMKVFLILRELIQLLPLSVSLFGLAWMRLASCRAVWRITSGRWETPAPVALAVRSTMTALEGETPLTWWTWMIPMCWRSGTWCLSSSTGNTHTRTQWKMILLRGLYESMIASMKQNNLLKE